MKKSIYNKLKYYIMLAYAMFGSMIIAHADGECDFVLGSVDDPTQFAYFLQEIFNLIKVAGPLLVIIMTIIDFVKYIADMEGKAEVNKLLSKTIKRIVYAVLLFMIPSLLDFVLKLTNIYGVCGIS